MSELVDGIVTVVAAYGILCLFGVFSLGIAGIFTALGIDLNPRENPIDAFWAFIVLLGMLTFLTFTLPLIESGTKAARGVRRRVERCEVSSPR